MAVGMGPECGRWPGGRRATASGHGYTDVRERSDADAAVAASGADGASRAFGASGASGVGLGCAGLPWYCAGTGTNTVPTVYDVVTTDQCY